MLEKKLIQIAGVNDLDEALMFKRCGVKYLGFPLQLPVHPQDITDEEAKRIIGILDRSVNAVLITYLNNAHDISGLCNYLGVKIVQIHGSIENCELIKLKRMVKDIVVVKSLIIDHRDFNHIETTVGVLAPLVDAFITDTFDSVTGASGATGKTHDWSISRRIVELSDRPVILAGGLTPVNVKEAIIKVRPYGVDSHTGVEDKYGRKSEEKVKSFVKEAKEGFDLIEKG